VCATGKSRRIITKGVVRNQRHSRGDYSFSDVKRQQS
jgi:hypothetical protein